MLENVPSCKITLVNVDLSNRGGCAKAGYHNKSIMRSSSIFWIDRSPVNLYLPSLTLAFSAFVHDNRQRQQIQLLNGGRGILRLTQAGYIYEQLCLKIPA